MKYQNLYLMKKKDLKKIKNTLTIKEAKIENNEILYICEEKNNEDKHVEQKDLKKEILEKEKKMGEEKSQNINDE